MSSLPSILNKLKNNTYDFTFIDINSYTINNKYCMTLPYNQNINLFLTNHLKTIKSLIIYITYDDNQYVSITCGKNIFYIKYEDLKDIITKNILNYIIIVNNKEVIHNLII